MSEHTFSSGSPLPSLTGSRLNNPRIKDDGRQNSSKNLVRTSTMPHGTHPPNPLEAKKAKLSPLTSVLQGRRNSLDLSLNLNLLKDNEMRGPPLQVQGILMQRDDEIKKVESEMIKSTQNRVGPGKIWARRHLVPTFIVCYYSSSSEGQLSNWNPLCQHTFGYSSPEGLSFEEIFFCPELMSGSDDIFERFEMVAEAKKPSSVHCIHRNGHEFRGELEAEPLPPYLETELNLCSSVNFVVSICPIRTPIRNDLSGQNFTSLLSAITKPKVLPKNLPHQVNVKVTDLKSQGFGSTFYNLLHWEDETDSRVSSTMTTPSMSPGNSPLPSECSTPLWSPHY